MYIGAWKAGGRMTLSRRSSMGALLKEGGTESIDARADIHGVSLGDREVD